MTRVMDMKIGSSESWDRVTGDKVNGLRCLPEPALELFGDKAPWSLLSSKEVAVALNVDPATFNAWAYRGVGPQPVRSKRRRRPAHRVSRVIVWLAARQGDLLNEVSIWREYLDEAGVGGMIEGASDMEVISFILKLFPSEYLADPI